MQEQSEHKGIGAAEVVLIFLVISIIVIAILTLLEPAVGTTPESIILNL